MSTLTFTQRRALAKTYSSIEQRAMKTAMKVLKAGDRDAAARQLWEEHFLDLVEAEAVIGGIAPEISDLQLTLLAGMGYGHPDLTPTLLDFGVTMGVKRLAERLGYVTRHASYEAWLADPLIVEIFGGGAVAPAPKPGAEEHPTSYTDEQLDALNTVSQMRFDGATEAERDVLLAAHDLAQCDFTCVMDGVRPMWTPEALVALACVPTLTAARRVDEVRALAAAGLDLAHAKMAMRLELIVPVQAQHLPETVRVPEQVVSATRQRTAIAAPQTAEPPAPTGPSIKLKDGTDVTDPAVRARYEALVEDQDTAKTKPVVMWPRAADFPDGFDFYVPIVTARPRVKHLRLESVKPGAAELLATRIEERGDGTMVAFDPHRGVAAAAHLNPLQKKVRAQVAARLGAPDHAVELVVHELEGRVDQVVVLRAPMDKKGTQEREIFWQQIILDLPGGGAGWTVTEEESGRTRLVYGDPPRLPSAVDLLSALRASMVTTTEWNLLPLGVKADRSFAGLNLATNPNALFVGLAGSGKTVCMLMEICAALTRSPRYEIHVMDPNKGVDFAPIRPWTTSFATTPEEALAQIQALNEERERRKHVLIKLGGLAKWNEMTPEQQTDYNVHPILLVADEFESLVEGDDIPKGLPKDHPAVVEAQQKNITAGLIQHLFSKLGREARYVGIALAIGTQRGDADVLTGRFRNNLANKIQMFAPGKPIAGETLRMVFGTELAGLAEQTARELYDGKVGIAVSADETGNLVGFRAAYASAKEMPGVLRTLGIAEVTDQWDLAAMAAANRTPVEGEIIRTIPAPPAPAPAVVEAKPGAFTFSLDDIEEHLDDEVGVPARPTVDFDADDFGPSPVLPTPTWVDDDPFD